MLAVDDQRAAHMAAFLPATPARCGALALSRCVAPRTPPANRTPIVKRPRPPTTACLNSGGDAKSVPEDGRDTEFVLDRSKTAQNSQGTHAAASTADESATFDWHLWFDSGEPAEMPMLPFTPEEIFLPGEQKSLHLYEARFLALFERSVVRYHKRFAHVLFARDRAALAAYGTLARVRNWRRLDVGVLVEIEGVSRLRVSALRRASPFWAGSCAYVDDVPVADMNRLRSLERKAWAAARNVVQLCVRLGESPVRAKADSAAPTLVDSRGKDEVPAAPPIAGNNGLFVLNEEGKRTAWETRLKLAAQRAADGERFDWSSDVLEDDVALRRAKAMSFAAWEFFPSKPGERQRALEGRDTIDRLDAVIFGLESYAKSLAAKAALIDAFAKNE